MECNNPCCLGESMQVDSHTKKNVEDVCGNKVTTETSNKQVVNNPPRLKCAKYNVCATPQCCPITTTCGVNYCPTPAPCIPYLASLITPSMVQEQRIEEDVRRDIAVHEAVKAREKVEDQERRQKCCELRNNIRKQELDHQYVEGCRRIICNDLWNSRKCCDNHCKPRYF